MMSGGKIEDDLSCFPSFHDVDQRFSYEGKGQKQCNLVPNRPTIGGYLKSILVPEIFNVLQHHTAIGQMANGCMMLQYQSHWVSKISLFSLRLFHKGEALNIHDIQVECSNLIQSKL